MNLVSETRQLCRSAFKIGAVRKNLTLTARDVLCQAERPVREFAPISQRGMGLTLAHHRRAMCSWTDFLDSRPGTLPETRILSDATVLVIFSIAFNRAPARPARMVLRFDQKGNMSAALQHDDLFAESVDEPLR